MNKTAIKQYQQATRDRAKVKTEGGQIIRVEAHPIPGEWGLWHWVLCQLSAAPGLCLGG